MPRITPLVLVPTTAPSAVATDSVLNLSAGETLWLEGRISSGTVSMRPYYFVVDALSTTGFGGAWVPLGTDAVAGNAVAFDATKYNGCASGVYDYRRAAASFVVVKESNVGPATVDFIHISTELASGPV